MLFLRSSISCRNFFSFPTVMAFFDFFSNVLSMVAVTLTRGVRSTVVRDVQSAKKYGPMAVTLPNGVRSIDVREAQ